MKTEKALRNQLDVFFTCSIDLLAVVGPDGYFKRLNPAFESALGYTEKELCSRPLTDFLHPDDVSKTKNRIQILTTGVATITSKNRYRCKDGNYKWFSWNTTPIDSLFYSVGRDITEQNETLEKKVQERIKELKASEAQVLQLQKMDAIGRLAGGIAHDFNNILSVITMYCDLLEEVAESPDLIRTHVKDVRQVTVKAAGLTRQLLIFSRKQIIHPKTIQLNTLITNLKNMLARLIGEHIEITTQLTQDLHLVKVDPGQFEQVLMNLVVNARDAMPNGGKMVIETQNVRLDETFAHTHLKAEPGEYVLLSISDNGCGMNQETFSKIFEPFFTTKPPGKGTGLGLTTVYGIVKQNNGSIWVYSEPDQGTVFKIYLPIALGAVEEAISEVHTTHALVGERTILLVEDNEKLRDGFSSILKKVGYEILTAKDGKEALRMIETSPKPIHLLVTDIVMPGLDGFELAKKAKEFIEDLRILYMSGYTSESLESNSENLPTDREYIQKPFNTKSLLDKIQELLS